MKDQSKTKQVLIQELDSLRQRIEELKQSESEWKKEKEGLTKSEARFRSYFDLPLHGIAITSPEKGWIQVNDRICSIMGYSRDEIVRMTWLEMTHPDDLAADLDQFNRVLSGQIDHYNMDKRFIRKDGKVVWTNLSVGCVRRPDGSVDHMVVMVEDITSVKLAEEALRESEDRYRSLFDNTIDAVLLTTPDGRILAANPEACRIFGRTEEEICRIGRAGLMDLTDPRLAAALSERSRTGRFQGELTFVRKDGASFPGEISSIIFRDHYGNLKTSMIVRNISDRKRAEEALIKSEEKFRKAFYTSPDSVNINRLEDGMYVSINPGFTRITGYTEEDIIGKTSLEYNIWERIEDRQRLVAGLRKDGEVTNLETAFRMKGGDIRYGLMSASVIDLKGVPHILSITRDISDRKQAEEALQESESKYRLVADNANDVIFVLDMNMHYTYVSPSVKILRGYEPEEVLKQPSIETLTPSSWDLAMRTISEVMELEKSERREIPISRTLQLEMMRKDGTTVWTEVKFSFIRNEDQRPVGILGVTRDITERKRTEDALQESEERLRDLIFSIADWVWEVDENGVYTYSSQKGLDLLGESPEDIVGKTPFDFMPPDEAKRVAAIFSEIVANKAPIKDLENWNIRRNGEKICLLTNGVPVLGKEGNLKGYRGVDKDITERKRVEKELAQSYDLLTNLARQVPGVVYQYRLYPDGRSAFPYSSPGMNDIYEVTPEDVRKDATPIFGRLHPDDYDHVVVSIQESARTLQTFYCEFRVILPRQGLRWRWSQAHPERLVDGSTLWHGIISDITERKQIEEQLQQTLESLRKAFGATIQVMVSAVEARDPYTAGHQIRSADLARAIATEMGLSQDTIEAIRMAGPIHDIGKLSIPAEILTKPTKLTKLEFSLIKEHSRNGYEMLKDVESPWPLAQIVYQHHERMNGSGYPRNLKGDEILMEARIMAVADVVESMASHRPYRPALGLKAALEEIENNRGTLYDADAVDVCLRLFREKNFHLEGA